MMHPTDHCHHSTSQDSHRAPSRDVGVGVVPAECSIRASRPASSSCSTPSRRERPGRRWGRVGGMTDALAAVATLRGHDDASFDRRRQRLREAAVGVGTASTTRAAPTRCSRSAWRTWTRRGAQHPDDGSAPTMRRGAGTSGTTEAAPTRCSWSAWEAWTTPLRLSDAVSGSTRRRARRRRRGR
jgi:hypothetical protein